MEKSSIKGTDSGSFLATPLPRSPEAERAVLGAILANNEALKTVQELLQVGDFFASQNRRTYAHMLALWNTGTKIDLVTLVDHLRGAGELDDAGGPGYVAQLVDGVPRTFNVDAHARIVKDHSLRRSLIDITARIQQHAFDRQEPVSEVLSQAQSLISNMRAGIHASAAEQIRLVPVSDFLKRESGDGERWLVRGLLPAQSQTIWNGRPKAGKSHTLLQLAFDSSCGIPVFGKFEIERPIRVAYVEFEEPESQTKRRFEAMLHAHEGQGPDSENLFFFSRTDLAKRRLLSHELLGAKLEDFSRALKEGGIEMVILIAARKLMPGDHCDAVIAETLNDRLDKFATETGAAVVMADHTRKAAADSGEIENFGSTMITARADAVFNLRRETESFRQVRVAARFETEANFYLQKVQIGDGEIIQAAETLLDGHVTKTDSIRRRMNEGESLRKAAKAEGVAPSTACRWLKE